MQITTRSMPVRTVPSTSVTSPEVASSEGRWKEAMPATRSVSAESMTTGMSNAPPRDD